MDPLSVSASIVALLQLSSTVIGYLSHIKGDPRELQRLRHEVCSILPILSILQDEAEQARSGGRWASTLLSLDVPNGPIQQFRAALEQLEHRLAPVKGWKKVGKTFTWPLEKDEILSILDTIERQKLLFALARQNDHMGLAKAIKSDVETINNKVIGIDEGMAKLGLSDKHHKIRRWLSGPDPSSNYNRALKMRHGGTGSWFIENDVFRDWKQNESRGSIIWLYGIPGCGKTILCSTILEHVLENHARIGHVAVLYFFFDFKDIDKQQHEGMIRSLLSQLSMHHAGVSPVLETLYSSCMDGGRQPTFDALLKSFHQIAATFEKIFIILDALDECKARPELLANIEELISWEDTHFRILATSRREKDVEDSMLHLTNNEHRICIQSTRVSADILAYVHDQILTNTKFERWRREPQVQMEIEDTLMEKVNGMFRWAACQLDLLGNCLNLPKLRKTLASLPKTLDDTYARILCDIDEEYQQYALHILQWLAFSVRPLNLEEIAEVVAIDINDVPQFDPQRRLPDPRDIVGICSSLITVTRKSPDDDEEADHLDSAFHKCYVGLAHFSVKEYLLSDIIRQGQAVKYSLDEMDCHVSLTKDCLAYLFQFDEVGSLKADVFAEYPLAQYTAMYLPDHARVAEQKHKTICQQFFLTKGKAFTNWIRLHDLQRPFRLDLPRVLRRSASPLFYASVAGLPESVRVIGDKGAKIKFQDVDYGNALKAASFLGHLEVVKVLIEKSVHLETTRLFYNTALRSAASQNHTDIAQMLLEKGAEKNELAPDALLVAIQNRDGEKVQLLIENEDAITKGDHYSAALELASYKGLQKVVEIILDKHVIAQDYSRALTGALRRGRHNIVHLLLDKGALIDVEVMKAAVDGETLQTLLDSGGDPSLQDAQGRHLCHYAAAQNNAAALEMLFEFGSDLTVVDKQGRTCLHHAVAAESLPTLAALKWLLKQRFDPNSPDRDGWTPLHWAAKCGHGNVQGILEEAGAKFGFENIMGWTPDDVAIFHHHKTSWESWRKHIALHDRAVFALDFDVEQLKPNFDVGMSIRNRDEDAGCVGLMVLSREVHMSQVCDGCTFAISFGFPIVGPRYRCVTCLDDGISFDYCFKCKQSSDDTHPGHTFVLAPSTF